MPNPTRTSTGLKVEHIGGHQWRFAYPPLYSELSDGFRKGLELYEAGQLRRAERVLRAVLAEMPDHLGALHHLALLKQAQGEAPVAATIWEEAVRLGRRAFPPGFDRARDRLEWRCGGNRPYLRCLRAFAVACRDEGEPVRALQHCRELLALNPSDDQAVRALAVDILLELGRPAEVVTVCRDYPADFLPEVRYALALALFQLGDRTAADRALQSALAHAPLGDAQARFWNATEGAMGWLRHLSAGRYSRSR
jgi:tetratricopeptide (TPR) repeat protein